MDFTFSRAALAAALAEHVTEGDPDQCWNWTGYLTKNGYGRVALRSQKVLAHRAAFYVANGYLTDGLIVRHKCDNRRCVNPNHLEEGTYRQNTRDALDRGRFSMGDQHWTKHRSTERMSEGVKRAYKERPELRPTGSKNGYSKLTEADIPAIRRRAASGESQSAIARDYGITQTLVSQVHLRKIWTHVPED